MVCTSGCCWKWTAILINQEALDNLAQQQLLSVLCHGYRLCTNYADQAWICSTGMNLPIASTCPPLHTGCPRSLDQVLRMTEVVLVLFCYLSSSRGSWSWVLMIFDQNLDLVLLCLETVFSPFLPAVSRDISPSEIPVATRRSTKHVPGQTLLCTVSVYYQQCRSDHVGTSMVICFVLYMYNRKGKLPCWCWGLPTPT